MHNYEMEYTFLDPRCKDDNNLRKIQEQFQAESDEEAIITAKKIFKENKAGLAKSISATIVVMGRIVRILQA